ncbi:MAG TPA: RecX family transcriptional regulator [Firmicutes bacterium]|nr:RecX family transcriptional regulator [Bacillota bacterium]
MTITEIRKRRGRLYLLVLDGEPAMTVDIRTFEESPYRVGSSLSEEELRALLDESGRRRAEEKAVYLLSRGDHSRRGLEEKLRRSSGREAAAQAAQRMEELGYVNDERYALRLARDLTERKLYPRRRAVQELCARGVDRELAVRAVDETEKEDLDKALELIVKKQYNRLHDEDGRRKAGAALARYGFDGGTIRRALAQCGADDTQEDGWDAGEDLPLP